MSDIVTLASPRFIMSASVASNIRDLVFSLDTLSTWSVYFFLGVLDTVSSISEERPNLKEEMTVPEAKATPQTNEPEVVNPVLRLENRHTGEVLNLRRVREADGRIVLLLDGSLPPGGDGPPLHIHFHEVEAGKVVSGILGVQIGTEKFTVPTGESAVLPAGIPHRWWNAGDDLLEFSGTATPNTDLDRFLQAVFAVLNSSPTGRPSIFYLAAVLWRHRDNQMMMAPPRVIQRIVFPVVLMIGRMLGKYRGSSWPGSPQSCPGAPLVEALGTR
jgi:mannose-6-phosphate isomerase-like protein (cupin superfamily)